MTVAELLEKRRLNWHQLDQLCEQLQTRRWRRMNPLLMLQFARLYRAACADLALADAYQLPPNTIQYLDRLVGRAHNQLYRSRRFDIGSWSHTLLVTTPRTIFQDRCVQLAFCLFWGLFILSAILAHLPTIWPQYATQLLTPAVIEQLETNFQNPVNGRNPDINVYMASYYIWNNTGIGLKCFAGGLLIVPGLFITMFNAAFLGASFGYMARPEVEAGMNFFHFVTAHGPFELTAIVLSAGAGLRLGVAWVWTNGQSRSISLQHAARYSMPIMGAAMVLFFLAALIEGFLSPSAAPYWIKALVAIVSSAFLMFYLVILGVPRRGTDGL